MNIESRPICYPEDFFEFAHDRLSGYGIASTMVRFQGEVKPQKLKEAFHFLFFRHPLLRARMRNQEGKTHFICDIPFENIPFTVLKRQSFDQWQEIINQELGQLFDTASNLWRITLLHSSDETEVILTFHHAISDGVSRMNLYEELIDCYEKLIRGEQLDLPKLPLHQPSGALLKADAFFKGRKPDLPEEGLTPWLFHERVPLEERSTGFIYKELPVDNCLAKGPAMTLLLGAAMVMAAQRVLNQNINIILEVPINLRPFCQPPVNQAIYGCYVTIFETIFRNVSSETSIWDLVRSCAHQFEAPYPFLASNFDYKILDDLENLEKNRNHFKKIGLINLGTFGLGEQKTALKPVAFFVASNQRLAVYAIGLYVIRIKDKLCLTFNYSKPALESATAEKFVKAFIENLQPQPLDSEVSTS